MNQSSSVQRDEMFPDDKVKVTFRLGPGHQSPRSTEMTAAKFQAAVKVASKGSGVVHGD